MKIFHPKNARSSPDTQLTPSFTFFLGFACTHLSFPFSFFHLVILILGVARFFKWKMRIGKWKMTNENLVHPKNARSSPDTRCSSPSKPYRAASPLSVRRLHSGVSGLLQRGVFVLRASGPLFLPHPLLQTYLEMHSAFRVPRVVASRRSWESTAM